MICRDICCRTVIPWVVFGDFSQIISPDDKEGGRFFNSRRAEPFWEVIDCYQWWTSVSLVPNLPGLICIMGSSLEQERLDHI